LLTTALQRWTDGTAAIGIRHQQETAQTPGVGQLRVATEYAMAGWALGGRKWHAASLSPLQRPREFSAAQLLPPAAAAGALGVLVLLEALDPESEELGVLGDDAPLEEDEPLELLPSFLVEL
jgi:hypothetical protein